MSWRLGLVLAAAAVVRAAQPMYTADAIVNAGSFSPGPFAPNSIVTIFGTNLSTSAPGIAAAGPLLPTEIGSSRVYVDNYAAPLLYVSDTQINFMIPTNQSVGPSKVQVTMNGNPGPAVTISIVDGAPSLFAGPSGYVIATHADGSLISGDSPAQTSEIIVVYCTGLGKTQPNPATGAIATGAAEMVNLASLQVTLGGYALTPDLVKYAGVTPYSVGLYQINLAVPAQAGNDPEIRVAIGNQVNPAGLKLAVRQNGGN